MTFSSGTVYHQIVIDSVIRVRRAHPLMSGVCRVDAVCTRTMMGRAKDAVAASVLLRKLCFDTYPLGKLISQLLAQMRLGPDSGSEWLQV